VEAGSTLGLALELPRVHAEGPRLDQQVLDPLLALLAAVRELPGRPQVTDNFGVPGQSLRTMDHRLVAPQEHDPHPVAEWFEGMADTVEGRAVRHEALRDERELGIELANSRGLGCGPGLVGGAAAAVEPMEHAERGRTQQDPDERRRDRRLVGRVGQQRRCRSRHGRRAGVEAGGRALELRRDG
jgi:hypothetical protein